MSKIRVYLGRLRRLPRRLAMDRKKNKELKTKLNVNGRKIYYFGVPEHSNLGDLAQYYCIQKYLSKEFSEFETVEIPSRLYLDNVFGTKKLLHTHVKPDDLIVFQSGYCTHDLGGREDLMHQAVLTDFPDNKMLMLPQTVFFKSEERKKQAGKIYNAHKHLIFLARDQVSFEISKQMFPDITVLAYPDIVTTLIGQYRYGYEREGILLCIRNDSEKYYSDADINQFMLRLSSISSRVDKLDTTIRVEYYRIIENLKTYLEKYFDNFSHYKCVITDRYHGTIFSLISSTPVIVIQSTDHKVKTGVDWFKGVYDGQIYFAENLEKAEFLAKELLAREQVVENKPYFMEEYYKKLRGIVGI